MWWVLGVAMELLGLWLFAAGVRSRQSAAALRRGLLVVGALLVLAPLMPLLDLVTGSTA